MSSICLCVTEGKDKNETLFYRLANIVKAHGRGVVFSIDWSEPIVDMLKDKYIVASISDCPNLSNCEMLLLPDGEYYNGYTNRLMFRERMKVLQDIADLLIECNRCVEFYIGHSGTNPDEFSDVIVKRSNLTEYLTTTVGKEGTEDARHIVIVSK